MTRVKATGRNFLNHRSIVRTWIALIALLGLLGMVALITYAGAAAVAHAAASIGFGITVLAAWHAVPLACSGLAWRVIMDGRFAGSLHLFVSARLVREAVNNLLPSAHVGGDLVGARMLALRGAPASQAVAAVIVDKTIEIMAQLAFTLLGLLLLALLTEHGDQAGRIAAGTGLIGAGLGAYVLAQRQGIFRLVERILEHLAVRLRTPVLGRFANLNQEVLALHRRPRHWLRAGLLHLASWLTGAGEVWLALHFMGVDASFATCLVVESLAQAVRSAGFAVPGALGIQEGGFMLVGAWFGIDAPTALALSLVKRVRELLLGLPALLYWHALESRRLARARSERID